MKALQSPGLQSTQPRDVMPFKAITLDAWCGLQNFP